MKNKIILKYYSNKKVRETIDKLLHKNSINVSSLGTNSKFDIGEEATAKAWLEIEQKIKKLDPRLYDIIRLQDDKETQIDTKLSV
tara:strand:- start:88 stop:342 length:255 start_codon:yes stop_codon:yes gene_type:complete